MTIASIYIVNFHTQYTTARENKKKREKQIEMLYLCTHTSHSHTQTIFIKTNRCSFTHCSHSLTICVYDGRRTLSLFFIHLKCVTWSVGGMKITTNNVERKWKKHKQHPFAVADDADVAIRVSVLVCVGVKENLCILAHRQHNIHRTDIHRLTQYTMFGFWMLYSVAQTVCVCDCVWTGGWSTSRCMKLIYDIMVFRRRLDGRSIDSLYVYMMRHCCFCFCCYTSSTQLKVNWILCALVTVMRIDYRHERRQSSSNNNNHIVIIVDVDNVDDWNESTASHSSSTMIEWNVKSTVLWSKQKQKIAYVGDVMVTHSSFVYKFSNLYIRSLVCRLVREIPQDVCV